jgi:beta-1,4-mannosyl-glycoprotein beta-1,4-N-acetylglucosaminyltransferase
MIKIFVKKAKQVFSNLRLGIVQTLVEFLPINNNGKIYDCFLMYNELDLLKLRIRELYDHVDHIVICECVKSFSGEEKQLFYKVNSDLFAQYNDKIIHYIIPSPPDNEYDTISTHRGAKSSERWQRNQIALAVKSVRPNDLILVSDIDEIPNSSILNKVYKICYWSDCVMYFRQSWFLLYLNAKVVRCNQINFASHHPHNYSNNEKWIGTFASLAGRLSKRYNWNLNGVWGMKWGDHYLDEPIIDDAGWHFSYIGGMTSILSKIKAFGVQLYSEQSPEDIRAGKFIGCKLSIESINKDYPNELLNYPDDWKHLMTHDNNFHELSEQYSNYKFHNPL